MRADLKSRAAFGPGDAQHLETTPMEQLIRQIALRIETEFQQDNTVIAADKRIPSSVIFRALRSIRPLIEERFGGPIKCRYPG